MKRRHEYIAIALIVLLAILLPLSGVARADWYALTWDDPNSPPADGYRLYLLTEKQDRYLIWDGFDLVADIEIPRGTKGVIVATCWAYTSDGIVESADSDPVDVAAVGKPINLRKVAR